MNDSSKLDSSSFNLEINSYTLRLYREKINKYCDIEVAVVLLDQHKKDQEILSRYYILMDRLNIHIENGDGDIIEIGVNDLYKELKVE